jgi:phage baseplate assembly protein W
MASEQQERAQVRRKLLGWSVACGRTDPGLDLGRDLELVTDPATGQVDLARVEGIDNLAQSLTVALTTARGSDVFNTDFGFDGINALADEPDALLARERVRIAVIQVLQKDPRVRRIVDVNLAAGGIEPVSAGSRTLDVNVSFETISLDQPTLRLGKVMPGG